MTADNSMLEEDDEGSEIEEEEYFDLFKDQATQSLEIANKEKKAVVNHSKLTEQLIKILRKNVLFGLNRNSMQRIHSTFQCQTWRSWQNSKVAIP